MSTGLLLITLLFTPAWGEDVADSDGGDVDQAEAFRLSQEIERLATRNQWDGVERAYRKAVELGAQLSFDDHRAGAQAAQSLGNITGARDRLIKANDIQEDTEILDWLWDIDSAYGKVFLAADPGQYALTADQIPFNPTQAAAITYAIKQVEETGMYEGYLPQGNYRFGTFDVEVMPRVQNVRIDVRSEKGQKKRKKNKD